MEPPSEITSELESFREQWRAEVRAKKEPAKPAKPALSSGQARGTASSSTSTSVQAALQPGSSRPIGSSSKQTQVYDHDDDGYEHSFGYPSGQGLGGAVPDKEPVTALEHYERAVAKEDAGSLGESLRLYRTAFKMDHAVDKKYKNKHFPTVAPPPLPKGSQARSSTADTTSHPPSQVTSQAQPQKFAYVQPPITDLLASFAHLSIAAAPPEIEGTPPPPCPIASLPEEILAHILRVVAVSDVGDFVRLALVCRRFAYLVTTEEPVWRRVCEGNEWGFEGMWRRWARGVGWGSLGVDFNLLKIMEGDQKTADIVTQSALSKYGSWKTMFRLRPRIRFNGVYICTVNYIRTGSNAGVEVSNQGPGGRAARNFSWTNPVHIVTYYRYLRFFRDGTVLSLATTHEPKEVVHHLTREEALALRPDGKRARPRVGMAGPVSVEMDVGGLTPGFMRYTLRGRWRLGKGEQECSGDPPGQPEATASSGQGQQQQQGPAAFTEQDDEAEDNLYVETEGVGKYIYRLDLALRGGGPRVGDGKGDAKGNNSKKLVWRGFYSYDTLTDEWGEFELKHGKPFFFSRVRSYGNGE